MTRFKSAIEKGTKAVYSYVCRSHMLDPCSCPLKTIPESKLIEILWDLLKKQFALTDSMTKQMGDFQYLEQEMAHTFFSRIEIGTDHQIFVKLRYQNHDRYLVQSVEQAGTQ